MRAASEALMLGVLVLVAAAGLAIVLVALPGVLRQRRWDLRMRGPEGQLYVRLGQALVAAGAAMSVGGVAAVYAAAQMEAFKAAAAAQQNLADAYAGLVPEPAKFEARMADWEGWRHRLDDLSTPLTDEQWSRLRLELRTEAANHPKDEQCYKWATDCGHELAEESEGEGDEHHVYAGADGEDLICLLSPTDKACFCAETGCRQTHRAEEARDELWSIAEAPFQREIGKFQQLLEAAGVDALDAWGIAKSTRRCATCAWFIQRDGRGWKHVRLLKTHEAVESLASIAARLGERHAQERLAGAA